MAVSNENDFGTQRRAGIRAATALALVGGWMAMGPASAPGQEIRLQPVAAVVATVKRAQGVSAWPYLKQTDVLRLEGFVVSDRAPTSRGAGRHSIRQLLQRLVQPLAKPSAERLLVEIRLRESERAGQQDIEVAAAPGGLNRGSLLHASAWSHCRDRRDVPPAPTSTGSPPDRGRRA